MWAQRRIRVVTGKISRRDEKLKALGVGGRRAIALVHVAAADPFCTGRHTNLISCPVVTSRSAGGMRAMSVVVARRYCVRTAAAPARMD